MTDIKIFPHADALRTAHTMAANDADRLGRPASDDDMVFFNDKLKYYRHLLDGWQNFEADNE